MMIDLADKIEATARVRRDFSVMPYKPAKLTTADFNRGVHNQDLVETNQVVQTYIDCGYPGPSRFIFVDDVFAGWSPYITYERAAGIAQ